MEAAVVQRDVQGLESELAFRSYRLKPEDRLLLRNGQTIELGGRAFDLLVVLVRSRGRVVSKTDIFDHVWPSTVVDESNLRFQMARLRRALGGDRDVIKTVKGRGYLLAAEAPPGFEPSTELDESEFRAVDPRADPVVEQPDPRFHNHANDGPPIVAVIDDDGDTREALDGLLRSVGIRVELFASVAEFIQSGRQRTARCLILDVWMPGRTGLDFQEDLRREALDLPIIFISGHADVQMSVRAMKAGAVEFLTKPVRYQDLLAAVGEAMSIDLSHC